MPGRMTLAEQLASIRDDAPVEYDPEAVEYGASTSVERDLDAGRADYLEVGPSQLRKNLDAEAGPRYAGTKASRSELFGKSSFGQSSGEDEDEDDLSEGSEDEDEGDMSDEDEEDGEEGGAFGPVEHSDDEQEDEEIDSDEASGNEAEASTSKPKQANGKTTSTNSHLDKESRDMIQELKKASSADIEKGRDVRKQLSFWDTLLEARIRLQKCVTSSQALPEPNSIPSYSEQSPEEVTKAKASLEQLSELLFSIRQTLYEKNDKTEVAEALNKKRKRGSSDYTDSALATISSLAELTLPYERTTVSKWSDKVSSASSTLGSQNKFKALGPQNTLRQIENILDQDMERLVERSRIRRGPSGKAVKVVGRDGAHEPVAGEKDVSAEVYDDTDFYQALLRDVVDIGQGGAGLGGAGGSGSYANFNNISRKKAAGVDPKASKGRKLRYHVHEKLQNFMAPIPMQTWEREQIDELFKGLLGGRYTAQVAAEGGESEVEAGGVVDAGQFRIF